MFRVLFTANGTTIGAKYKEVTVFIDLSDYILYHNGTK